MIKVLLLGMLAAASAAPRHHHRPYMPYHDYHDFDQRYNMGIHPAFGEEMFDTNRFWADMQKEMRALDDMMANFHLHFPTVQSTAGVVDNQYKVTIPLAGFDTKDIVVKAREGVLMVQAKRTINEQSSNSYLDVRTIPTNVNVAGLWTYTNNLLTIVFPLKGNQEGTHEVTTETATPTTASREEMDETTDATNQDADVGVKYNDSKENEITSNAVEATTYAVDLKNEVEFVPVHYR